MATEITYDTQDCFYQMVKRFLVKKLLKTAFQYTLGLKYYEKVVE